MKKQIYRSWLAKHCEHHEDIFIKHSESIIKNYLEFDKNLPDEYEWMFSSENALEKKANSATNHQELNSIYWKDQSHNIEAYLLMTHWRGSELVKTCLEGVNRRDLLVPAISARSLLELSTVFLLNANDLQNAFNNLSFPDKTVVVSSDVEKLIVRMIWGTRYDNTEKHLIQANIMTSLQRLSKHPEVTKLMPTYEFLCDIAHPSFIGNTNYWSHINFTYPDGSENRILSRSSSRKLNTDIIDKTIWALTWSSECIKNAFHIMDNANKTLLNKLAQSGP